MSPEAAKLLSQIEDGRTDFAGANFSGQDLTGVTIDGNSLLFGNAQFQGADLSRSAFSRTNFVGSSFKDCKLESASFDGCILIGCDFYRAKCSGINLFGGSLEHAFLVQADMSDSVVVGTSFENALLGWTNFRGAALATARDLDKVQYASLPADAPEAARRLYPKGRVTCDLDMKAIEVSAEIYRVICSREELAEAAKRLASPNVFIAFLDQNGVGTHFSSAFSSLLTSHAKDYETVFISYSTKDQRFADLLYEHLRFAGVKAWYAPKDMEGGRTILEQVKAAISSHDRVVLILSEHSLGSGWVANEVRLAHKREQDNSARVLFPISIVSFNRLQNWELHDADSGIDLAHHVRSYFVPDFSGWQSPNAVGAELQKLVKALRKR